MKIKASRTENITVDISEREFLTVLATIMEKVYEFDPSTEYINNGYICYDVKYHTWEIEKRRKATSKDSVIKEIFMDIENYLMPR